MTNNTTTGWDVIVIGAGSAGLSAALMLGRSRRTVLMIDSGSPRNRFAEHMHGVLGNEGAAPSDLLARGRAEVSRYGVELRHGEVETVHDRGRRLDVRLGGDQLLTARAVILATGITDELPDIPGLAARWGTTVLSCPYCHGWEVRDRRLGVLATSPLGLHQAYLIRQLTDRVTVFTAGAGPLDAATEQRLRARDIRLVPAEVSEVVGDGSSISGVRTADGDSVEVDALFTTGTPRANESAVAELGLEHTDSPFGQWLTVDQMGRTSNSRVWAIGNVVNPALNVPMSIGAGAATGGAVNMALATEDFDRAVDAGRPDVAPADFWEHRYADTDQVWSGRANQVLTDVAGELPPGTALDLGCGEGGDAIWLAENGWQTTGIDISETAVRRATEHAHEAGLGEQQARFRAANLATVDVQDTFDLVTASFLHSPVQLPRTAILRRAAELVAPGGHLLITSHAQLPPWSDVAPEEAPVFPTPREEIADLDLPEGDWQVRVADVRTRRATPPQGGEPVPLDDGVVLLQRTDGKP